MKYRNTFTLIFVTALFFILGRLGVWDIAFNWIDNLGYFAVFIGGLFFTSVFTIAPSIALLSHLSLKFDPMLLALVAGIGAVIGDYIIFRFLRERIFDELKPIFFKFGGRKIKHLLATKNFIWITPALGAAIIASPLPDELGIGLLGASKISAREFKIIAYVFNVLGILIIALVARGMYQI